MKEPSLRRYYDDLSSLLGPFKLRVSTHKAFAQAIAGTSHMITSYATNLARFNVPDSDNEEILMRW